MKFLPLTSRNLKEIYRDPVPMVFGTAMPVVLLLLFTSIGKKAPVEIFSPLMLVPAVAVFSFGFLIMFSASLISRDRQTAFLTRLLMSPLKSSDFILAYLLAFFPLALLQSIVCFLVGTMLGMAISWQIFLVLLFLLLLAVACIGIGMILGSLGTENQVAMGGSILMVIISLFSGAWMDLKMVGGIFKTVGYALPFAHAIDGSRAILKGSFWSDISVEFYWVFGYALISIILGIIAFKWRMKQ
jgi:ABC-2 type transport system permease protein